MERLWPALKLVALRGVLAAGALLLFASRSAAQDLFEIQVYPYETVAPRQTMVEMHMNFYPSGTKDPAPGEFANHQQFHFTVEITHGLAKDLELGWYVVTAYVPGVGPKLAGARIRPRFRLPEEWHLPFKISVSTELGFNKHQFEANTMTLEIRPILEREWGRWYLSLNPTLSVALQGPDSGRAPSFEPGVKVGYEATRTLQPGFEYYAETGPVTHFSPAHDQHHLIFPTLDLNVSPDWELNFGVGRGLTGTSEHWIVKWIIGRRFRF